MEKTQLYAAPMEGLTGFVWRKAHDQVFGGTDKYFSPFIVANQTGKLKTKEIRDISQNEEKLVPQLMSDKGENLIWAVKELQSRGFKVININAGCPSATVVSRGKGAALLKDPVKLDALLDRVFSSCPDVMLSVKTRIGWEKKEEWPKVLAIYEKYPISELIVHSRVKTQMYEGPADRQVFLESLRSSLPLVYNGDVVSPRDEAFTYGCGIMCGRGLLRNPAIFRQVRGGKAAERDELILFHDLLLEGYESYMDGSTPVLHHMKEIWFYLSSGFAAEDNQLKKVLHSGTINEYQSAVHEIMRSCPLKEIENGI